MALVKITQDAELIEIVGDHRLLQVRSATFVRDDETGEVVGKPTYTRRVVTPASDLTDESDEVRALCDVLHTQAVKDAYAAAIANPVDITANMPTADSAE